MDYGKQTMGGDYSIQELRTMRVEPGKLRLETWQTQRVGLSYSKSEPETKGVDHGSIRLQI